MNIRILKVPGYLKKFKFSLDFAKETTIYIFLERAPFIRNFRLFELKFASLEHQNYTVIQDLQDFN